MQCNRHPKAIYSLGIDPAGSGKDYAAFVILEKKAYTDEPITLVFRKLFPTCTQTELRDYALLLDSQFNFDKIYVDLTGIGEGLNDMLHETFRDRQGKVEGVRFTNESKNEMFNNLYLLMLEKKITFPETDRELTKQLLSIKYDVLALGKKRIYHEEREHDDLVCALALAGLYFSRKEQPKRNGYLVSRN